MLAFFILENLYPGCPQGMNSCEGSNFLILSPMQAFSWNPLSITGNSSLPPALPVSSACSPSPTSQRWHSLHPPVLTMIYYHRVKISKVLEQKDSSGMHYFWRDPQKARPNKQTKNKTKINIEKYWTGKKKKKYWNSVSSRDPQSACQPSAYLPLHLSICLSMFHQS